MGTKGQADVIFIILGGEGTTKMLEEGFSGCIIFKGMRDAFVGGRYFFCWFKILEGCSHESPLWRVYRLL